MLTTQITTAGNLAADVQLHFGPSGTPVARLLLLVNTGRRDQHGQWQDDEPTRHSCKAFGQLAEHLGESVAKGDRLLVTGTVRTESWTDKDTGQARSMPVLYLDDAGPSVRHATATPHKAARRPDTNGTDSDPE